MMTRVERIDRVGERWLALTLFAWLATIALCWPIPFMAWDHLDLVPLLQVFRSEGLRATELLALHGGHYHGAAYLWLLASPTLADGAPLADIVASLLLLVVHAWLLWRILDRTGVLHVAGRWRYLLLFLVLFPGHLANLQWGWQVAVFMCLVGATLVIERLTATTIRSFDHLLALVAGAVACTSFASGLAILPVAIVLLLVHHRTPWKLRLLWLMPWVLLAVALSANYFEQRPASAISVIQPLVWLHYFLNFLSGALYRTVTSLSVPIVLLAMLHLGVCLAVSQRARSAIGLCALLAFVLGVAALTATGRSADYGAEQAFVTRYASFSILFWIAWAGIALLAAMDRSVVRQWLPVALWTVTVFAVLASLHFSRKAVRLGERMENVAIQIRSSWPGVSQDVLSELYFGDADAAASRLRQLCEWRYPPFSAESHCSSGPGQGTHARPRTAHSNATPPPEAGGTDPASAARRTE